MTKGPVARAIILSLLILLALPAFAGAREYAWDFDRSNGLAGWELSGAAGAVLTDRALRVTGTRPTMVSPAVGFDARGKVLMLRIKSPVRGAAAVGLVAGRDIDRRLFDIVPTEGFRDIRIYLGGLSPRGGRTYDRVVIQFPDTTKSLSPLEVDFVRIDEPGPAGLLRAWWTGFWDVEFIDTRAATVSNVKTPRVGPVSFLTALYVFMALVFAAAAAASVYSRRASQAAVDTGGLVARAAFIAFMAGGALYTLRMDYNWLVMWGRDIEALSGRETRERTADRFGIYHRDFDVFLDFIDLVKSTVPEGAPVRPAVRPPGDTMGQLAKYFLLPVMTSDRARFIWVFDDGTVYDPATLTLRKGLEVVAYPVREVARLGPRAALYEEVDEAGGANGTGEGGRR